MEKFINSIEELNLLKSRETFTFVYFKNDKCSVCGSLYPQLEAKISEWNEQIYVVDCFEKPEIAAQNIVLTVPALKVYYDGQEVISMLRFVDILKLEEDFERIKRMIS